ncbi:MAG TPA: hypothetical protein VGY30_02465 [Solirubrobacteraceae bacterium]|nr:hypothetical protein [Solirubrobacteraceae bacterium]
MEIVADGGRLLGFGHVGRCLALWEELNGAGAFRVNDEAVAAFLKARGAPVASRPLATPLVLLDHAEPTTEQAVRTLQATGRRVVLLDDLGSGRMAADAVIDPPTAASWPPAGGVRLGGFEHVLLRREIRRAATGSSSATPVLAGVDPTSQESGLGVNEGVLLAMGGSDPAGLTAPLAKGLLAAGVDVTVALGPGYRGPRPAAHSIVADGFPRALACAALLVCGYGHSLLEAAYLGVPAIAVVFRPEHLRHAQAFCNAGTACMLDMTAGPCPAELAALAGGLLADVPGRARMARRGRELVDGDGAARVAAALVSLAHPPSTRAPA